MIHMPGSSYRGALPPPDQELERLREELRADVVRLAQQIGERNLGRCPQQLSQAADHVAASLHAAGGQVRRQRFVVDGQECCNLEVERRGATRADEVVIIGAHYDSALGTPGANDNATGVAAVLALARRFASRNPTRTVRFVAFVNEEPPYFQTDQMGSRVYARRCRAQGENVVAMLSLETMGYYDDAPGSQRYPPPFSLFYPSVGNFIGFVGNFASRGVVRQSVAAFRAREQFPSEGAAVPGFLPGIGLSDHWSFWQEGYPAAMVTDTAMFRYPHYHERQDTSDKVDFDRLSRVVRGLEQVVAVLADD
jgi:hypothetical protein